MSTVVKSAVKVNINGIKHVLTAKQVEMIIKAAEKVAVEYIDRHTTNMSKLSLEQLINTLAEQCIIDLG